MNRAEVLRLVALNTFRVFNKNDWMSYSGCETTEPLICETDEYTLIVADTAVSYIDSEGDEMFYEMGDGE